VCPKRLPLRRLFPCVRYSILWSADRKFGGGTWQHWYRRPLECYTSGPRDKNLLTWLITSCFSHPLTILWTQKRGGGIRETFSFKMNFDLIWFTVLYIPANSQKVQKYCTLHLVIKIVCSISFSYRSVKDIVQPKKRGV
jgi:hypothetical protein